MPGKLIAGRPRAYLAVLRSQLRSVAHFRANLLAWVLYSPLQIGILYLLWRIVYSTTDEVGGFAFHDMILYYLLIHLLRRVIEPVQTVNFEVWSEINKGTLDSYLARPLGFGPVMFSKAFATPLLEAVIGVPFFVAFSFALDLPVQTNPAVLATFVMSLAAGFMILFLIQFIIGSLSFWMERIFGLRDMVFSVFILFSGQLIPISALPSWVATVSKYLPFQGIYYVPARIYTEAVVGHAVESYLLQQMVWVVVLWGLAALIWARGVARYASQGG